MPVVKPEGGETRAQFRARFRALPDDAKVQLADGRVLTKRQILAQTKIPRRLAGAKAATGPNPETRAQEARDGAPGRERQCQGGIDRWRATEVTGTSTRTGGDPVAERETIRRQAALLWQRAQRASPAEQAEIEQQAQALLARAKQLGK